MKTLMEKVKSIANENYEFEYPDMSKLKALMQFVY